MSIDRRPSRRRRLIVALALAPLLSLAPVTAATGAEPEPGAAEMFTRRGDAFVPLPVVAVDIELDVTGPLVRGRMSQRFVNPSDETIEATYVFPLNDGAAVHAMEIRIGERRIVARVQERERARQEYAAARAGGRRAALVTQRRPNLFRTAVANIDPGESVDVEIEWLEEAVWRDDRFSIRLPLTFIPRFDPTGSTTDRPVVPPVRLEARLRTGFPLAEVASRTHALSIEREGDGLVRVRPAAGRLAGDRDLLLEWAPLRGHEPASAAFVERRQDGDYALVLLIPPAVGSNAGAGLPTETVLVVDVSGSMAGPSIEQARQALLAALDRLRPEDRFDIVAFSDSHRAFAGELVAADADGVAAARRWVTGLTPGGGTMLAPALGAALDELRAGGTTRHRRAIFLTDGAIGNEAEVLSALAEQAGEVRLHALGIGQAPNGWLIRRLAEVGRGVADFVATLDETDNRVDAFLTRLDRPIATDLEMWWDGVDVEDVTPARLPDLYAGEPLVLSARLRGGSRSGRVLVGGWTREGPFDLAAALDPAAVSEPGIAIRWARRRIAALLDEAERAGAPDAVRDEVTALGLDFGLVTPHTSLVAVEVTPTALGVAAVTRPVVSLPAGGTDRPLRRLLGVLLAVLGAAAYGVCAWTRPR